MILFQRPGKKLRKEATEVTEEHREEARQEEGRGAATFLPFCVLIFFLLCALCALCG
jgi:hypothetical protein